MTFIRRSMTALIVLCAVLAASAFAQSSTTKTKGKAKTSDPIVQDRPLSEWVADLGGAAPYTRVSAAYAVGSAGPAAKSAVPALIENLSSENSAVRYSSTLALGEIGPDAAAAVPALQKALDDRSEDVAAMARKSLKLITGEAVE
jgi:HEAT repeat protein